MTSCHDSFVKLKVRPHQFLFGDMRVRHALRPLGEIGLMHRRAKQSNMVFKLYVSWALVTGLM